MDSPLTSSPLPAPGPFVWTVQREEAAALVADDTMTNAAICTRVGISLATLARWKHAPEFTARVEEHLAAFRKAVLDHGVARLELRVGALDDRWQRLRQVIEERARDQELTRVPGGSTGLLVRHSRGIGSGDRFERVDEYLLDAALLREMREHEKQAAYELGHWQGSRTDEPATKAYVVVGPDDL
jgi:hypothetical protein